jgi:hypothetical protein
VKSFRNLWLKAARSSLVTFVYYSRDLEKEEKDLERERRKDKHRRV